MRARTGIAAMAAVLSAAGVIGAATTASASTGRPAAAAPASGEAFRTVIAPAFGKVARGVSFTPGTGAHGHG